VDLLVAVVVPVDKLLSLSVVDLAQWWSHAVAAVVAAPVAAVNSHKQVVYIQAAGTAAAHPLAAPCWAHSVAPRPPPRGPPPQP